MKFGNKKITGLSPENHQNGRQKITRVLLKNHQNGRQKITRVAPENHQNSSQKITRVAPKKHQNCSQKIAKFGPKMFQNLLQKWSKLGSKMMKNVTPPGSEIFRDFFREKWVVRASGAHYAPHAVRKRLFCSLQAQFGVVATKPWREPAEKSSFERNFFLRRQAGSGQPLKKVPFRGTLKG